MNSMFNKDFCAYLEYEISKAFKNATDPVVKHFWCGGILMSDSDEENIRKTITNRREIISIAYIGTTGQERYKLTLKFGNKALSRYARNLSLEECVPETKEIWYDVNVSKKEMTIYLL